MTAKETLPQKAQETLKGTNIKPVLQNDTDKYSKKRFAYVYQGYDMLQNIYTIRTYIQKRYGIDQMLLEILLNLMGLKIFTRADFSNLPKSFTYARWKTFKDSEYVNLLMNHYDTEKRIYTLSAKGKNIVIKFYEYLSGEKKIPTNGQKNPMANKNKQRVYDKKKLQLIKKLNKLEVPEHKRFLFE